MRKVDSLEKTLMLEGIEGRRRRGRQRMRWFDDISDSMSLSEFDDMSLMTSVTPRVGDGQGGLARCSP